MNMINILLVDDDQIKIQKIIEVLTRIPGISENSIEVVRSIISAKKALIDISYDLVLLDVQIPLRDKEEPIVDGGIKLLETMCSGGRYRKPRYIVGLTAYEETFKEASNAFSEVLWTAIKYEDDSDKWEMQISSKVEDIIGYNKGNYTLQREKSNEYIYDLAIICALNKTELESVLQLSSDWEMKIFEDDSTVYHIGTFETLNGEIKVVAASASEMGMPASSVLTMKLIQKFRPEYLVMTGIAAGVKDQVGLGDILIADPSWDYGAGKFSTIGGNPAFMPDAKQLRIAPEITARLELLSLDRKMLDDLHTLYTGGEKPDKPLSLYIGPVASGASVVAHSDIVKNIIEHNRKLVGLEMETYGVYFAAAHCIKPSPTTFSIKSVCDFADSDKKDNCHKYAAYTSSRLMHEFVTKHLQYCYKTSPVSEKKAVIKLMTR